MRSLRLFASAVVLIMLPLQHLLGDSIDGGVIQVRLPNEDVTLFYVEAKGGMTVELKTESTSVEARKFYLGDGKVAVELKAHRAEGILFQGRTKLDQGFQFKKGSVVKVQPGYRQAVDLAPGEVYVTLPGVTFEVPAK